MKLSKLNAAQRQMDSAIGLYFAERDEVSHPLVGAAHILLTDLSKAAKQKSPIDQHVKPEFSTDTDVDALTKNRYWSSCCRQTLTIAAAKGAATRTEVRLWYLGAHCGASADYQQTSPSGTRDQDRCSGMSLVINWLHHRRVPQEKHEIG